MAIINLVSWSPDDDKVIYAWRFPHNNLSTYTQLIVQESQVAVLFSKGQILGKFGPGKHTLNTENLPIIRNLFGIPFGGKNPFTAEVWFVNKIQTFSIDWCVNRMPIHDPDYNTQLPLVALGKYGLKIVDPEKFLVKIVGTRRQFDQEDMTREFSGEFFTKAKSTIVQYMLNNGIGYKEISAHLDVLSEYLKDAMNPFWNDLGFELTKFYVSSIDIDDSTEEGMRIKDAISRQGSMSITGHTWQQEQMFDTANNAIGGLGNGNGGLLGGLVAINMMGGMGGNGGAGQGMMQPQYNQPNFSSGANGAGIAQGNQGQPQPVKMVYCSNCSKKFPSNMQFCPHCGDKYNPCPNCGTDNDANAKRCVSCGAILKPETNTCPNCGAPLAPGVAFCGNCGHQLQVGDKCSRCGATLPPSVKFCPVCGQKR